MIDDVLVGLFGEAVFGRLGRSARAQLLARLFFGLIGAALGLIGAVYIATQPPTSNRLLHLAMIAVFGFLTCFALFNVALGRPWRWPGRLFIVSVASLFVFRILVGP